MYLKLILMQIVIFNIQKLKSVNTQISYVVIFLITYQNYGCIIFSEALPGDNNSALPFSVMPHNAGDTLRESWTSPWAEHHPYFMPHNHFCIAFNAQSILHLPPGSGKRGKSICNAMSTLSGKPVAICTGFYHCFLDCYAPTSCR